MPTCTESEHTGQKAFDKRLPGWQFSNDRRQMKSVKSDLIGGNRPDGLLNLPPIGTHVSRNGLRLAFPICDVFEAIKLHLPVGSGAEYARTDSLQVSPGMLKIGKPDSLTGENTPTLSEMSGFDSQAGHFALGC
jgi:hypothetical protein